MTDINYKIFINNIPDHLSKCTKIYSDYTIELIKIDVLKNNYEYYLMTIYKHITLSNYFLIIKYGKIKSKSHDEFIPYFNQSDEKIIKRFNEIFEEKTGEKWENRDKPFKNINKFSILKKLNIKHNNPEINSFLNNIIDNSNKLIVNGSLDEASKILKQIESEIEENNKEKIVQLCTKYYEIIPSKNMEIINKKNIKFYIEQLESFIINQNIYMYFDSDKQLPFNISILQYDTDEYKMILSYLDNKNISCVYKIDYNDDIKTTEDRYILLWHGTKNNNVFSILINGLIISNKSGLMFGNGIYFADVFAKSFGYTESYIFLCKIKITNIIDVYQANSELHLHIDKNNIVKGIGRVQPKSNMIYDDMIVPSSKLITKNDSQCKLNYNEYVIYNPDLIKIKYVIKL
jgi:hypothetical protein